MTGEGKRFRRSNPDIEYRADKQTKLFKFELMLIHQKLVRNLFVVTLNIKLEQFFESLYAFKSKLEMVQGSFSL